LIVHRGAVILCKPGRGSWSFVRIFKDGEKVNGVGSLGRFRGAILKEAFSSIPGPQLRETGATLGVVFGASRPRPPADPAFGK
jgi:hypothetical protein